MRIRRTITPVLVSAAAVSAALLTAPVSASATPSPATPKECYAAVDTDQLGASGSCSSGSGTFYLQVRCTDELRGSSIWLNGPRVAIGKYSSKECPFQGGVQFKIEAPLSDNVKFHF